MKRKEISSLKKILRVCLFCALSIVSYIAAQGNLYFKNPEREVYKTEDGGGHGQIVSSEIMELLSLI